MGVCMPQLVEDTVQERMGQQAKAIEDMTLDELDELEDEEDDRILQQYRSVWYSLTLFSYKPILGLL